MPTWRLYTYDVWGNDEDGFNVNDVYRQANTYDIPEDATYAEVLAIAEGPDGFLEPGKAEIPTCYDTSDVIYFEARDNGHPVCELRRE